MKTLNQQQLVARMRKAGVPYIGREEARAILGADDAPLSGPKMQLEPVPQQFVGANHSDLLVDKYDLNPGVSFIKLLLPGAKFVGTEPRMFGNGDLPLITGSGADPQVLRSLPWQLRHAGFATGSRAHLAALLEESVEGDLDRLQTSEGRGLLSAYFTRVRQYAITPPDAELTDEQITNMFPSWSTVVHG
jgi:hypothetical protein